VTATPGVGAPAAGVPPAVGAPAGAQPDRPRRLALVTISVAQLMFLLDATIVNVALPSIQRSLHFSGSALEWVVTGYSIAFGGLLLLGGRAGDLLGLRRLFVGGLVVFTLASLLGGLATAPWWLLACRAVQGVAAAGASPAALSLIAATFPDGPPRHRALGVYTAIAGAGGPIGLVAGGLITTYLSWRWVMFANVPVGLLVIAAAVRAFRPTPRRPGRFDTPGALTATLGVTLLVYGLISAATDGTGRGHWADPPVLVALAAGAALLAAFVAIEARTPHALVPLRIFADRSRSGTYLVLVLSSAAMFGVYFFLTLFLQRVRGYTALQTAVLYVPLSLLLMAGAKVSSRVVARTGARPLAVWGLAVGALGMAWMSRAGEREGLLTAVLLPTVVTYGGLGLTAVPLTLTALANVRPGDSGLASGLFNTARQVGGAIGLAVIGTVAWSAAAAADHRSGGGGAAHRPAGGGAAGEIGGHALAAGVQRGFAVAAAISALGLLVALLTLPRGRPDADRREADRG
jgi:EmrB/QacA subfamily drug resistance transporter